MRHAISLGARTYNWPSLQEASAMLAERIAQASHKFCSQGPFGSSSDGESPPRDRADVESPTASCEQFSLVAA